MNGDDKLTVSHLSCGYQETSLFSDVNFELKAGNVLQVVGPNGSGKTTLLRVLSGLVKPAKGEVRWRGASIDKCAQEYKENIVYQGHKCGIKSELTVRENVLMNMGGQRRLRDSHHRAHLRDSDCHSPGNGNLQNLLGQVGLAKYIDTLAGQLSRGQVQRLALCRLFLSHCSLWILDEPFTAMDEVGKTCLRDALVDHLSSGGMAVVATHEPLFKESSVGMVSSLDLEQLI